MPRCRSLSCFSIPANSSSTFTYNTVYSNIGQLLAQQQAPLSEDSIKKTNGFGKQNPKIKSSKSDNYLSSKHRITETKKEKERNRSDGAADSLHHMEKVLTLYPWYHGDIDRLRAEKMVLGKDRESRNGMFLVRKSVSRVGQHVITFNNNAQATHLQFMFNYKGECKLKSKWFDNIFDMLEYFRSHPLPVESARHTDVMLAGYVSNLDKHDFAPSVCKREVRPAKSTANTERT